MGRNKVLWYFFRHEFSEKGKKEMKRSADSSSAQKESYTLLWNNNNQSGFTELFGSVSGPI
jgi:sarcosine oxidase delta subunit